eukprot:PLAT10423.1.p1 GENE.PLAT10423.1~~PLAT10423.1.p1  ORF type:complete len:644 (+),score=282.92 PLAT10423.1:24-1934(+)
MAAPLSAAGHRRRGLPQRVTAIVVGDAGVGKTSLINTYVSGKFREAVPAVLRELEVPPEHTGEGVFLRILDSTGVDAPEEEEPLLAALGSADVVLLVHDVTAPDGLARVRDVWLPLLEQASAPRRLPVVLVGNKTDELGDGDLVGRPTLTDAVAPLLWRFKSMESCIEVSCRSNLGLLSAFYLAMKAVIYPAAPLLDQAAARLTPACAVAAARCFRWFDADQDGLLNDEEMLAFQHVSFGVKMDASELEPTKRVLAGELDGAVRDGAVTLQGFLHLQQMFVQRSRPEVVWAMLRRFGYDLQLNLQLPDGLLDVRRSLEQPWELSPTGWRWLDALFRRFDRDGDGALNEAELAELFSVCPQSALPWEWSAACVESAASGKAITRRGWLAQWSLQTQVDVRRTLRFLFYLCNPQPRAAVQVAQRRRSPLTRRASPQRVVNAFLFGAAGVGKSALCGMLLGRSMEEAAGASLPLQVAHTLTPEGGKASPDERVLLLREVAADAAEAVLRTDMPACDVVCLLFEAGDMESLSYVKHLQAQLPAGVPAVLVASKGDTVLQGMEPPRWAEASAVAVSVGQRAPLLLSAKAADSAGLYHVLCLAVQRAARRRLRRKRRRALLSSAGLVALAAAAVTVVRKRMR